MFACFQKRKYFKQYHRGKKKRGPASAAENKLLLLSIVFVLIALVIVFYASFMSATEDSAHQSRSDYFHCEAEGIGPEECDRSIFEQYNRTGFTIFTYLMLGAMPLAILLFVVNCRVMKLKLMRFCCGYNRAKSLSVTYSRRNSTANIRSATMLELVKIPLQNF